MKHIFQEMKNTHKTDSRLQNIGKYFTNNFLLELTADFKLNFVCSKTIFDRMHFNCNNTNNIVYL